MASKFDDRDFRITRSYSYPPPLSPPPLKEDLLDHENLTEEIEIALYKASKYGSGTKTSYLQEAQVYATLLIEKHLGELVELLKK